MPESKLALEDAYRQVATIRCFEQAVLGLSHEGEIAGSVHPCLGQEAIPVGAAAALGDNDLVVATYRGHGWALALGADPADTMAEILQREGGLNGGRAGSALLSDPPRGLIGENSIVGAGVPISTGLALAAKERGHVVVTSIGDGAMNQGATNEGLIFAAALSLPLIVVCENNGWSEMTPIDSMVRTDDLVNRAVGLGITAKVVDGCDPFAVADAVAEAADICRSGAGPVFLECKTVRLGGHYNADIEHYRSKQDKDAAADGEPLQRLAALLAEHGGSEVDRIDRLVSEEIDAAVATALARPAPSPASALEHLYGSPVTPSAERPFSPAEELTYQRALNLALIHELDERPELLIFGEDVGAPGGIFGVTRSLQKRYGADRVFDTPIAESAILGAAVGASIAGLRPVAEVMWADFLFVALDQLVNQAANVRYINRSLLTAPLTVRVQQGVTPGSCAQHSQSVEAILAHIPGLKVGLPTTPQDAYDMLRSAVADPDPVILIEARGLYQTSGQVASGTWTQRCEGAVERRSGGDLLVVSWGQILQDVLQAADDLAGEGIEACVLDLRWLRPLDTASIDAAVRAVRGRVLVVHEAHEFGGFGAEVAAGITERNFDHLIGPVDRLGAHDARIPAAPGLQAAVIPTAESISNRVRTLLDQDQRSSA